MKTVFLVWSFILLGTSFGVAKDGMIDGYWVLDTKFRGYCGMAVNISGTNYECWGYSDRPIEGVKPAYPIRGAVCIDSNSVKFDGLRSYGYNEVWHLFLHRNYICLLTDSEHERYLATHVFDTGSLLYKLPDEAVSRLRKAGLMPLMNYSPLSNDGTTLGVHEPVTNKSALRAGRATSRQATNEIGRGHETHE